MRATAPWLLAFLFIASAGIARTEDASHAETSEENAEKGDTTKINKQLTNPVSELWSIQFQQNNYRISPGIPFDQGERWSSNLLLQRGGAPTARPQNQSCRSRSLPTGTSLRGR
jgi:hypothetical protein